MKNKLFLIAFLAILSIFSCNSNANNRGEKAEASAEVEINSDDFYFTFSIDGKDYSC